MASRGVEEQCSWVFQEFLWCVEAHLGAGFLEDIGWSLTDKNPLHLEISLFIHFMVKILFHKSNDV